jgi:Zn-dependent protease with chaperone function
VQITITARSGETRIHLEEHFDNIAGGLFGGILGGGGSAGTAVWMTFAFETLHFPLAAVLGGASVLSAAYGMARTIYTRVYAKRSRQLEALADRLAALVEESGRERLGGGRRERRLPR